MKKIICILILSILCFSCSTSPYIKESELPNNIIYYSTEKQFKVDPEWYWRLRPENKPIDYKMINQFDDIITGAVKLGYLKATDKSDKAVVGRKYFENKNKNRGVIVGEIIRDNEKFYVVNWSDNGYFFIRNKDYNFDITFKNWLIPFDYSKPIYLQINSYFKFINNKPLTLVSTGSFIRYNKEAFTKQDIVQRMTDYGYTNDFLKTDRSIIIDSFLQNDEVSLFYSSFALLYMKDFQYTNNYGQLFLGKLYSPVYLIINWGENYYALPYEPFEKMKGVGFN